MLEATTIITRREARAAGLRFYFTGKPCAHGHIARRNTKRAECLVCARINIDTWTKNNPERARAARKRYKNANRIASCAQARKWAEKNRERRRAWRVLYREKNRERIRATARIWAQKNREALLLRKRDHHRKWKRNNPDKRRIEQQIRRSRKRMAGGIFNIADINRIRRMQINKCAEPGCRRPLESGAEHIDHIVPLGRGGSNWPSNLQLLCPNCNHVKGNADPLVHARRMGRLI